jgi:hypothetical protein
MHSTVIDEDTWMEKLELSRLGFVLFAGQNWRAASRPRHRVEVDVVPHAALIVVGEANIQNVSNTSADEGARGASVETPNLVLVRIVQRHCSQ